MSDRDIISDEMINAFIDDQLDEQEREMIIARRLQDPQLDRRLCELRRLKEMVRLARPDTSGMEPALLKQSYASKPLWISGVAASVLLVVVMSVYWLARSPGSHEPPGNLHTFVAGIPQAELKVLVHYTQDDAGSADKLLHQVEQVLREAKSVKRPIRIEVLAHGKGIYLLNKAVTPYAARIKELSERYDNLRFVACQATMQRVKLAKGIEIELLPQAVVVPSGKAEIQLRKRQGWEYLQV